LLEKPRLLDEFSEEFPSDMDITGLAKLFCTIFAYFCAKADAWANLAELAGAVATPLFKKGAAVKRDEFAWAADF
jgi:hypothetical protein